MNVILLLIPLSLVMAALFLGGFIWAVRSGQYEDTFTPNLRVLAEEDPSTDLLPQATTEQAKKLSNLNENAD